MAISEIDPYVYTHERRFLGLVISSDCRAITRTTLKPRGFMWTLGLNPLRICIFRNDDTPNPTFLSESGDIAPGFDFTLTVYLPFARWRGRFMHRFLFPYAVVSRPDATGKWIHRIFDLF